MNGFLFKQSGSGASALNFGELEWGSDVRGESVRLPDGETLELWGRTQGDIDVYQDGNGGFALLSGYIAEIVGRPRFAEPQQMVRFLFESLGRDSSDEAVKGLLGRLRGSFAIIYHDGTSNLTVCLTDRIASRPVFRSWTGSGWAVSSHVNAMALTYPSLKTDPGFLAAFLLYGGPVNPSRTLFTGVQAVAPGTVWRLGPGPAARESAWYRFSYMPDSGLSRRECVDLVAERLVRAAGRIASVSKNPVVFFSGGVDSRLAAAALQAAGAKPTLVTLAEGRNLEVSVASAAAKALGLPHHIVFRDPEYYLRSLPKAIFETGGSFSWAHGHFANAIPELQNRFGADAFVLGDFCEAFSKLFCSLPDTQSAWTSAEFAQHFDEIRSVAYRPVNRERTLSLLRPEIREAAEDALTADMEEDYRSRADTHWPPAIIADQLFRWQTAATLPTFFMFLDVRSAGAERNLMFDADVHELLEILRPELRDGANLGALVIRKLNRAAGGVINSNTLLPLHWPPAAHKFAKGCKPYLGKVRRLLRGDSSTTTGSWPKKAALYTRNAAWRTGFERALTDGALFADGLFEPTKVAAHWAALSRGQQDVSDDVERLVQLSLLNRLRNTRRSSSSREVAAFA